MNEQQWKLGLLCKDWIVMYGNSSIPREMTIEKGCFVQVKEDGNKLLVRYEGVEYYAPLCSVPEESFEAFPYPIKRPKTVQEYKALIMKVVEHLENFLDSTVSIEATSDNCKIEIK